MKLSADDPRAATLVEAIHVGDIEAVERLLVEHRALATARFVDPSCGDERTALHVVTDWPGHVPNGRAVVASLVAAGADVDAAFGGAHAERPLHWAASSDDVEVLEALLEAGADIEATGSVIDGGSPLADEITNAFWCACHGGQRTTAERLLQQGADIDWLGHDGLTPLGAAVRSNAHELAGWLRSIGARELGE